MAAFSRFWSQASYQKLPTSTAHTGPARHLRMLRICIVLCVAVGSMWLLSTLPTSISTTGTHGTPLDYFQSINPAPIIGALPYEQVHSHSSSNGRAVVTSLYSNSYAIATAVLGHTIREANVTAKMLLIYLDDRVSNEALCISRAVGWETIAVPYIPPPHLGEGILEWYRDQYTKLNIWSLDTHGVDRLVYLDSDTLVLRNFDELFDMPFNFAAVPDVYAPDDARGFALSFNAGVLALRPSSTILEDMLKKIETANFDLEQAEQSFLNAYFASKRALLPYAYNAGIVIKRRSPALWEELKRDMKILHFTNIKPFLEEEQTPERILTDSEMEDAMDSASQRKGIYADEIGWWRDAYRRMILDKGHELAKCRHHRIQQTAWNFSKETRQRRSNEDPY